MRSALYYPHTEIQSESLLKTSLLLWDELEFIVPNSDYRPQYDKRDMAEAVELIGKHRPLSDAEKQEAHDRIEEFATRKLPPVFYYRPAQRSRDPYEIYSDKLLMTTWEMLRQAKLAGAQLANTDYPLDDSTGLSIMSILADCRAGETLARVTDQGVAYATVTNLLVESSPPPVEGNYERIVPLTLKVVNAADLPLSKLIEFRKREDKSSSPDLRNLRHRYVARMEEHVKKILVTPKEADRKRLESDFEADMKDDLALLKTELREIRTDTLLSKDIIISAVAALTAAAAMSHGFHLDVPTAFTLSGAPVTVGGLLSTRNKYGASRRSIMQKHPMAYMYEVSGI
jgi:hypothetical protein